MRAVQLTMTAIVIAAVTISVSASGAQRQGRPQQQQATTSDVPGDATSVGRRLYEGVLGRAADPGGLAGAAAEIQRGRINSVVNTLVASDEFRNLERTKSAAQLLDQFYRGLLQRSVDQAGTQSYLTRVERRDYAGVILELANSNEFRNSVGSAPATSQGGGAGQGQARGQAQTPAPAQVNRLDAALACQAKVIEAVRKDAGGRIFLSFDRMPDVSTDGQTVSGSAMDRVVDRGEREMSYRCAAKDISYSYKDRRGPVAMDSRVNYPSAAVRNCQNAIRDGLAFDAASLSASDTNAEYVIGITGGAARICTMDRQRVVSVK